MLLGAYLAYVEDRIILRGIASSVDDFVGHVRYMRSEADYLAMPSLGLIPGSTHTIFNARGMSRGVSPTMGTL